MRTSDSMFTAKDGKKLFVYRFLPDESRPIRAAIHIAHGMAEHAGRYARLAQALTGAGFAVYAHDCRGHGKTAADGELGFVASKGSFDRLVQDVAELIADEKAKHPGLPMVLFAHSMGSYVAQKFIIEHGNEVQAVVLSGSTGKPPPIATLGRLVARIERLRVGERGTSGLLQALSFGDFNKQFAPNRTAFDWLSRDNAEVDKYIADPFCGFAVSTALWVDLLDSLAHIARPDGQARVPKELPVYIFSGSLDPTNQKTKGLEQLVAAYKAAGLKDVTHRFYSEARHETLNETNRDEVTRDLLGWLDAHVRH